MYGRMGTITKVNGKMDKEVALVTLNGLKIMLIMLDVSKITF